MYPRKVTKATLTSKDDKSKIEFQFNPTQVSLSVGCNVSEGKGGGPIKSNRIPIQSTGPKPSTLKFDFILDSTEPDITDGLNMLNMMNPIILSSPSLAVGKFSKMKVVDEVNKILNWTDVIEKTKESNLSPRPHVIFFKWPKSISFTGMISSLGIDYLLFDSDGEPRRVKISFELKGYTGDCKIEDIVTLAGTSSAKSEMEI